MDARAGDGMGVRLLDRAALRHVPHWQSAFEGKRKDHRFYEILEDTIAGYDYRYFVIGGDDASVCAVQPAFLLDQDLVAGVDQRTAAVVGFIRKVWPRFLKLRTLMVGCVAGEGHLDGPAEEHAAHARALVEAIIPQARRLKAPLVVLKEYPARHRVALAAFVGAGFARIPSMPMTKVNIGYDSFDDYMAKALNGATRRKLRKKFKKTADAAPLAMSVTNDVSDIVGEVYPLYLAVYNRSKLHFEKLTEEFFCEVGRRMPDNVRFFVWRQEGRIVAFTLCMLEGENFYAEYVGLDYHVALDLHLWHVVVRDMTNWAIANGFRWFCSSGLNYDPKLHCAIDSIPSTSTCVILRA
jgi:Peptidogalycan biosysnthesis/recognition